MMEDMRAEDEERSWAGRHDDPTSVGSMSEAESIQTSQNMSYDDDESTVFILKFLIFWHTISTVTIISL